MAQIRILVVDDHAVLREGICALLARHSDLAVAGEAGNGSEALQQVQALRPDVVLMDISMPEMDGLEATRYIRAHFPETRVLILTQHDSKEYVMPLLEAGASGYILKKAGGAELVNAIRAVFSGGTFLYPPVATQVVERAVQNTAEAVPVPQLTERECEVLRLVVEGLSSREIAERLCLSVKTVMTHRANIMEKMGVHNSADLVKHAIRAGLVQP